jgi:hypothetical protein
MSVRATIDRYVFGMRERKVPIEALKGVYPIHKQSWAAPLAADDDYFVTTTALPASAADWVLGTPAGFVKDAPDFPRNVVAVCSGSQSGNLVAYGWDIKGRYVSETIALNGATPVAGKVAFASYQKFRVPAKADSETIKIGTGIVMGLDRPLGADTILFGTADGVQMTNATRGTVVLASQAANADRNGTWAPHTNYAADGSKILVVYYIPSDMVVVE